MKKGSLVQHKEVAHGEIKVSVKLKKVKSKKKKDKVPIKTAGPGNKAKSSDWTKTK